MKSYHIFLLPLIFIFTQDTHSICILFGASLAKYKFVIFVVVVETAVVVFLCVVYIEYSILNRSIFMLENCTFNSIKHIAYIHIDIFSQRNIFAFIFYQAYYAYCVPWFCRYFSICRINRITGKLKFHT